MRSDFEPAASGRQRAGRKRNPYREPCHGISYAVTIAGQLNRNEAVHPSIDHIAILGKGVEDAARLAMEVRLIEQEEQYKAAVVDRTGSTPGSGCGRIPTHPGRPGLGAFQRPSLDGSHANRNLSSPAVGGCSFLRYGRADRHSAVQRIPRSHSSASLRSRSALALSLEASASLRYRIARALLMASHISTLPNKDLVPVGLP